MALGITGSAIGNEGAFLRGRPLGAYGGHMTDEEVAEGLQAVLGEIRAVDITLAVRAVNSWADGDLVLTHTLVLDMSWGYWLSDAAPPAELHPLQDELAARRRAARGAIGRPIDFYPPSRYGHLRG